MKIRMNNRLFIVCPFSNLEYTLKKQYGQDSHFLSVPAGLISANDNIFLDNLKRVTTANSISEIYVTNEVSNSFVLSVMNDTYKRDIAFLNPVADLKEEFWMERFAGLTPRQQILKMAELIVELSVESLQSSLVSINVESAQSLTVRGIVLSKEAGFLKELKKMNRYKIAYGL